MLSLSLSLSLYLSLQRFIYIYFSDDSQDDELYIPQNCYATFFDEFVFVNNKNTHEIHTPIFELNVNEIVHNS